MALTPDATVVLFVVGPLAAGALDAALAGPAARRRVKWFALAFFVPPLVLLVVAGRLRGLDADGDPRGGRE